MYCQVIVDIAHENVARPFIYRIPEGIRLSPGQRVAVPFRSGEKEGIVLSLTETAEIPPSRIRAVIRPLEDYPAVLPALMGLAEELTETAHCTLAESLRLMIPAEMRGGRVKTKETQLVDLAVSRDAAEAAIRQEKRSEKKRAILRMLLEESPRDREEILAAVRDPQAALKALEAAGLIRRSSRESLRTPGAALPLDNEAWHPLTEAQREALEEILPALGQGTGRFLLHGVTGSGKTEVFLNAVRETLKMGRSAIILVPEIALTPQMVRWFRARFGPVAAVLHSRLSPGERYDEWRRIRRGEARVIIGARSAVFAPTEGLGLIVIDEEHETTYQSEHRPRYDAREVAESRCRREGASLILASATPSLLSFAKARRGDYTLLEMPHRVAERPLPEVTIVDMRQELEEGNRSVLSRELVREIREALNRREQVMLLMNRRGYHSFVSCRRCGYVVKCSQCDVSMTVHVGENGEAEGSTLKCHYCGNTQPIPARCPECGSPYIRHFGAGTQKVEAEVQRLFPDTVTARMDIDTTGGKDGHARILERFRSGEARVLIGTQMIAKGLDFPQVTVVGVIAADQTLNLPDYRSRERTFQLLTQVAGRAGRGTKPGRVVIQTYKPEDAVIRLAARQDYRAFFEEEFRRRRIAMYPPFTLMARILFEAPEEASAEEAAAEAEREIRDAMAAHPAWKKNTLLMIRQMPGIRYLRGLHRRQILFKLKVGPETDALCACLARMADSPRDGVRSLLEINPANMI